MGGWMPPSPNPGSFFFSTTNDDVVARPTVESDGGNRSGTTHFPGSEEEGVSRNADQKNKIEADFGDNETSNSGAVGGPKLSSQGGLVERIAARAGFNAPRLNTESIRPADLSNKPEVRSPYLTIPPGLSPTTLQDSPVSLSNSLVPPSPTTGKFSFAPNGDYRDSTLMTCNSDKGKENIFEDINASSFVFKPITKSASFPYFAAANKSFPSAGFNVHSNTSLPRRSIEPTKTHLPNNSTLFQEASFSKPDMGYNGSSNLQQQTHNSVDAMEHSPPFDEQNDDGDQRSSGDPNSGGSTAEDGYNWRKYGQKHVKGSEYPRSYYKCTHPSCPVKKKVERSQECHITEIIYKGAHIHPKPPPCRRSTLGSSNALDDIQLDSEQPATGDPIWSAVQNGNVVGGWKSDNHNFEATSSALLGQEYRNGGGTALRAQNGAQFESGEGVDESATFSNDEEEEDRATHGSLSLGCDGEGDELESKRRRIEAYAPEMSGAARPIREPRVVVQTTSEVDILDDGYRWRKYGRKVVKGNPNPRNYYKCTSAGCNVRKHVERASHDLKSVLTRYEGKHNHDVPAARNSGTHANSGGQNALLPQQAPAASSNIQRPEPSQIRGSIAWFERPPGSFGLPPGRPQLGPGPGFGLGMNQRGLAGLGFVGIGHNPGKLAALPNHPYLGRQGRTVNDTGYMVPKSEQKMEPETHGGSNESSVYQELMSRMPPGPQM